MVEPAAPIVMPTEARGAKGGIGLLAWIGLAILVLLAFVSYLDRQIIALMVAPIEHDLRVSDTQIGLLQGAAFALAYPIFAIPIGYAADRYSRRWVIFWSVSVWAIAAMLSGLADSFGALFVARVGVGLGEAAVAPAVASLLSDVFPKRRLATIFSIYGSGVILGSGAALWLGEAVLAWARRGMDVPVLGHLAAWQIGFIVTGAPALVLGFLVFFVPETPRRPAAPGEPLHAPWSEVFAFVRQTWLYLTCYVVGQTLLYSISIAGLSWLPAIMQRSFGWGPAQLGSYLALFVVLFGFPGQMSNGLIVDRMFRKHDDAHLRYYVVGAIIIALSGALAPLAPSALIYLLILGPSKFLLNFSGVFGAALQVATPSRLRGRVTALTGVVVMTVGSIAGPSAVAFFTDVVFHDRAKVILSYALTTAIAVPIAGVLFVLALKPMREAVRRERELSPDPA